jgi:predicted small secreted protein
VISAGQQPTTGGAVPSQQPVATLDARYSGPDARAVPWPEAAGLLEQAELFWVSTIRPDGRLHVTPVVGVWLDGAFYFSSGAGEQKSKNLAVNRQCAVTSGCNTWEAGFDIVLHGEAVVASDLPLLRRVAAAFLAKYGQSWAFDVADDGTFSADGHGSALVYEVVPAQAVGFGKGEPFSHTRWDFRAAAAPAR